MDFMEIAERRQSCRNYDGSREIPEPVLERILEAGRLAPSACNAQPYHFTLCTGMAAKDVAKAVQGMGMNRFADRVPAFLVISEQDYNRTAAMGAKVKKNDYRSIDIGIAAAYLTAEATAQGLGSCILGWFDDGKLRKLCGLTQPVRLVIALGYEAPGDPLREKKRKAGEILISRTEKAAE